MSVCRNDVIDCHQKLSVNQTLFRLEPLFDFFFVVVVVISLMLLTTLYRYISMKGGAATVNSHY